ncbi:MAG: phosphonopyruvate decarboxylase [Eubacterium sp.]|nr:phosphonopyruvate decarboxylase [Eubacterium sp.]
MIDIKAFLAALQENGVGFFAGVPDSNLNDFCKLLNEEIEPGRHVIAANEGNAVAIASGYYFGNGCVPLVYMQNSGLGNSVNPLVSLCDPNVYSVPMVLVIGWRGDPAINDHAQHKTQGRITPVMLDDMKIPYMIMDEDNAMECASWAPKKAAEISAPAALIVKKGVLAAKNKVPIHDDSFPLSREEAMNVVLSAMPEDTVYSATTGRAARELYELRNIRGEGHEHDYLNVGSMGHASSVALGMALSDTSRHVICFDGDGAALMHMGSLAIEGQQGLSGFMHIVLDNGVHESVGGQPTVARKIDFTEIAKACGFDTVEYEVNDEESLKKAVKELCDTDGPGFIDAKIHAGLRPDMPPLRFEHKETIESLEKELRKRG